MAGQKVPIEAGLIARVSGAIKSAFSGGSAFMGPNDPMPVQITDPEGSGTVGRAFDYQTGYNLTSRPRSTEATTFEQLRALADGCDILRAAIETRKDAVDSFKFTIKPRKEKGKQDTRCRAIQDFLQFPDGEHDFSTWARAMIEDMLVIDAATIYPWKTNGGDVYRLELVDGATIKKLIDVSGRTPAAPSPAYQQVIKGLVVSSYTTEELIYHPRNFRTNKIYGHSVVEQINIIINMAIRRALHQLQFYTEGSTPDLIFSLPDTWTINQIRDFDAYWNDKLSGDTAARRRTQFVPGGVSPVNTKDGALQDVFDEWLARVICYAMNVPNHWAIKQQTRAGQGVEQSSADKRGDEITRSYLKSIIDRVIAMHFKAPDLCLEWDIEEELDPEARSRIHVAEVKAGLMLLNEAREENNLDPVEGGDVPMYATAAGYVPIFSKDTGPKGADDPEPDPTEKIVKFSSSDSIDTEQVDADGNISDDPQKKDDNTKKELAAIIAAFLADWWRRQVLILDLSSLSSALDSLKISEFEQLRPMIDNQLSEIATRGALDLVTQAGGTGEQGVIATIKAVDRVTDRINQLLMLGGSVSIADSTRRMLKPILENAVLFGIAADDIDPGYAISPGRADDIAENEGNEARQAGKQAGVDATDTAYKRWVAYPGCCPQCAALDGEVVPVSSNFSNGADWPPLHNHCRCELEVAAEE